MELAEKMKKARIQLILDHPFFASLALKLTYIEDKQTQTTIINGKCIKYNPDFIKELPIKQIATVLAHEVLHILSFHHMRRENRDKVLWNKATDYAINPLLIRSEFQLPDGALLDHRFDNMNAERIYSILMQEQPSDKQESSESQDYQGMGDVEDLPETESKQEVEAQIKQAMTQAAMIAKSQGNLPDYIERLVSETIKPKVSWREALQRFFSEITKDDYTWTKPSTRYLHNGLYLPSLETPFIGKVILIVDTSSSISNELINSFAAEVQEITSSFSIPLTIIYVDTKVQAIQEIEPDEIINLNPKGGGGTNFKPGFEFIDDHNLDPETVIYLTDGECYSFPTTPDYNVLWAQFGSFEFNPPFGEVIQVTD
ncbi:vWA domain-containing protein [Chitinophaga niabensis]|uniref:Predicted metal-dependent peptidase n=1 Tax=Chitinophaga niabensis TaxID=536979 RepID=A0A1N6KC18_9BACT|nr:VWA-like domain-containing protein [Chitinophaga niabensis]SIO53867.1 Predicted metal-dependent peptidase [Chitinophaga niabensis]